MTSIRVREVGPVKVTGSPGAISATATIKGPPGDGADVTAAQIAAARDAAVAAAAQAQAVPTTADGLIAGQVGASSSQTRAALEALFSRLDAVPPAVQQAITSGLINNSVIANLAAATGYAYVLVDQAGRIAFGVKLDGTVEVSKFAPKAGAINRAALAADVPLPTTTASGTAVFEIVDSAGRGALWVAPDGTVNIPKLAGSQAATLATLTAAATPLAAWGDSLTAGGSDGRWSDTTAADLGVPISNFGVGGQQSPSIAARQGGRPGLVTVPSNTIPAAITAVTVTTDVIIYSHTSNATTSGTGTLGGVPGTLTRDNNTGVTTFTRTTAGTVTWVAPLTPWVPDAAETARDKPMIIWTGRNSFKLISPDAIVDYVRRMVEHSTALRKRFLVLEIPPWVGEESAPSPTADRVTLNAANAALQAAYPNQFVPVAQYLRGPALADMGMTPTAQDNTDIANGITPTSLRVDVGHPNATGHIAIGHYLAKIIRQKGWVA